MQFHLNGFKPGDPTSHEEPSPEPAPVAHRPLPPEVDVLIVGSGPTGLTLAAQLAAFPGIRTAIVEQKVGPLQIGQADGIACRTMEMFQAFGFCERVAKEAYWVNEVCFWKPDDSRPAHIIRSSVVPDVEPGLSEFPHVILNQARIHEFFLDIMRRSPACLEPHYYRQLVDIVCDNVTLDDPRAFPVTARFQTKLGSQNAPMESVRARYVVGCDGARSTVRQKMGEVLLGDSANQAWGVMDVLAVTDFPDIRRKAAIHSAVHGSILIIPREGGYLVRLYIELEKLSDNQRVGDLNVSPDHLIAAAQRILNPFTLDVKEIAWWSVYEIGQRLCLHFDYPSACSVGNRIPRVFIAGDACHTHSPKAGQGMNVSMQDAFNLGWKLAAVLGGHSSPAILKTYSTERQAVAKELIEFDHQLSRMFSAKPRGSVVHRGAMNEEGVDPAEFQSYFLRAGRFTAGTETRYQASLITGDSTHQSLATGYPIGMRFHSTLVTRFADSRPMHLGHTIHADGRWRLFLFADQYSPHDSGSRLGALCRFLAESSASPVLRYTSASDDIDSVIDVIAIFQQARGDLPLASMPAILLPRKGRFKLVDYEKIFCAAQTAGPDVFEMRSVNRQEGALIVVRPDQHVAHVLPLNGHAELARYFSAFMLKPSDALVDRLSPQDS